ncbi:hypothetical protein JR316_0008637 [Psilocybe cubensis]|uniref:Uncharacterized protein n=2 Tax=Psilocybe cubensis TaxID=181762 RepID=A0ACB8GRU8_PSICU|nr:hypothetical protein JR316_0008637 [Psilocybe cubensis]KAH9478184.1 hypothetical protein JR316_0008637 [Psilocybe cubensis]
MDSDPNNASYDPWLSQPQYLPILENDDQPDSLPSLAFIDEVLNSSEALPPLVCHSGINADHNSRPMFAALFDAFIALPHSPAPSDLPVMTSSAEERVHLARYIAEECLQNTVQGGCAGIFNVLGYMIMRAAMRIDREYLYEVDFTGAGYVSAGSSSSSSSGSDSGSAGGSELGSESDFNGHNEVDTARWKGAGVSMEKLIALVEDIASALGEQKKLFAEVLGEKLIGTTKFVWDKNMFPAMRKKVFRESHLEVHMRRAFRFSAFLGELFVRDIIFRNTLDACISIILENDLDTRGEACIDQLVALAVVLDTARGKMWDVNLIMHGELADSSVSREEQRKKAKENEVHKFKTRLELAVNDIVATEVGYARTQKVNHKREVQTWMRKKGLKFWEMEAKYVMGRLNAIVYRWSGI